MKRTSFALALLACLALTAGLSAEAVMKDGYAPGQWTMDWDAALAYAKQNKLPVFVDFTGSDWCGWCKLMQANVFSKPAWADWAKNRLVLVTIDFPNDETIVPEKYKARNQELSDRFGVEGYPTYVVLDADGATELGRLGAGQEKTVASFTAEIQGATRYSLASLEKLTPKLGGAVQSEYRQKLSELGSLAAYIAEWKRRKAEDQMASVKQRLGAIQAEYALGRMSKAEKDAYAAAKAKAASLAGERDAWLESRPDNTQENQRKYQNFQTAIAAEQARMEALVLKYLD